MRRALVVVLVLCPALVLPQVASARPGMTRAATCPRVPQTFGRMFAGLPAAHWPVAQLDALADEVMAEQEAELTAEGLVDDEENADIDAGYTYTGQLIDHDLTSDNRPNDLTTPVDPRTLANGRTPAFDLDSVYGGGPAASPQLYAADHAHLLLGAPLTGTPSDPGSVDMPRDPASGQALAGDPRDDENRIVAGLHTILLRFHNEWVDRLAAEHPRWSSAQLFGEAQKQVRWHYQWAVLTDFLPTVVGRPALSAVFPRGVRSPRLSFYRPCAQGMPVEFSVAAYRFGHSMVRPIYRLNAAMPGRLPVFASLSPDANDLGGFRPSPPGLSVDWRFFFEMEQPRRSGFPQSSYRIDNSLVFPLSLLPAGAAGTGPTSLAVRNLLRGQQVGCPAARPSRGRWASGRCGRIRSSWARRPATRPTPFRSPRSLRPSPRARRCGPTCSPRPPRPPSGCAGAGSPARRSRRSGSAPSAAASSPRRSPGCSRPTPARCCTPRASVPSRRSPRAAASASRT